MGLMELPHAEPGQLIVTPHPMLLDGQRNTVWEARPGESLYALLMRNVPELDGQPWAVSVGGRPVERHLWHHVYPKAGQVIEVRGGVGRSALAVVAMIALTYFTFGGGAIAGFTLGTSTALGTLAVQSAVYIAGSMLINKVLAPKPPKAVGQQQDSVYSITGARNQLRPYDPLPLLFGRVRLTPDLFSKPYTWYEGNDQYLGMLLCAGINVGRVEEFYNGDTLLSTYEGAQVFHAGYSQMPEQAIPLYSNADVIDGGQLIDTGSDPKHQPSAWVERTGSADTVRLVVAIEYQLYDKTSKGKDKNNTERVEIQYRPTGTTGWLTFGSYTLNSNKTKLHRVGYAKDVARGQYDVRVRTAGLNTNGSGAQAVFAWTTLTSVQVDEADYTGISRTGVKLKATGQLNGSPDELRAIGHADPIPVWTGTEWATQETSNPGAQILAYARGIVCEGRLLGGMALSDAQIDIESLKAFSLHCAANGYAYNFYIKDARNHEQVLSAIALAGFGQITWAGGRLGVVWAAQDQPLSGVVNMGTIKKGQFQVDYSLSNAADGIEYTYIDETTWETKTLRVPAPGVTTMLNPAQVTGEGVTTEEHAARMARWHLAQSLYQYKDISYSTDIEHLSYQRLSVLAMQHDMTQWGYGGRVVAAAEIAGVMTLRLDEPVPAPPSGVGYIGLRIPGERVYRVLKVKPFTGESDTIELLDEWPSDAAVPGAMPNNPAHDTLWIYDFKQTPGLRVRVVSVEPESDLKGASVRVVQEGAEFWNYVLTGDYVPSPSGSLLQTRPVASNLRVTEQQVVQGNTTFTELTATFDVSGPVGNVVVRAAADGQELEEVAQTQTRMATWRIPSAGAYNIVVRPFSPDGEPGVAASVAYVTAGAELPPKLVDLFNVEQRSGGVRLYTWGWLADTVQSPDFAGVEIRYVPGSVPTPTWDSMTPVGDTGYHTAAFEAVVPAAGEWTFACRSRNSAGELSTGLRVVTLTLAKNLGEQLGGIGNNIDQITQQQVALQQQQDQDRYNQVQGDLQNAQAVAAEATERANAVASALTTAAADATAKANAARDTAIAHADVIGAQVADILDADEWVSTVTYPKGDLVKRSGKLYRALSANTNKPPESNTVIWQFIGNYTSLGEAVAASVSMGTQNTSDIAAQATQINGIVVRMPTGTDKLANEARVALAEQAAATANSATAGRVSDVAASLGGKGANLLPAQYSRLTGTTLPPLSFTASANVTTREVSLNAEAVNGYEYHFIDNGTSSTNRIYLSPTTTTYNLPLGKSGKFIVSFWARAAANGARIRPALRLGSSAGYALGSIVTLTATRTRHTSIITVPSVEGAVNLHLMPALDGVPIEVWTDGWMIEEAVNGNETASSFVAGSDYSEAISARVTEVDQASASRDAALSQRTTVVEARMPSGTGALATAASVTDEATARGNADSALATRTSAIETRMPTGTDKLANEARVVTAESAAASANSATAGRLATIEGRMPSGTGALATAASVTDEATARTTADNALATRAGAIEARMPTGNDKLANEARVVSAESAAATANNAVGSRVGLIEGRMPTGSDKLANEARIVAAETAAANATGAVATQVNQVKSTAEGAAASVTTLTETVASAASATLLLPNPGFETSDGWVLESQVSYATVSPHSGSRVLMFGDNSGGTAGISAARFARLGGFKIDVSRRLRATIWNRVTQGPPGTARARVYFNFRDGAGALVGSSLVSVDLPTSNRNWTQAVGSWVAPPAGAVTVEVMIGVNAAQSPMYCYFDDVIVEVETPAVASANAKVTNVLDVNGNISGTVSENDGVRSSFTILGAVFRVISSLTGMGMEWLDGYLRIWKGSAQLLLGHSFGSGDLVMWYGPNVGAANCTKLNGLFHLDTSGGGYFGGSLSAGTLKNAVQTTNTATSGVEIVNGPFSTNGNVRNVVVSYSRNHRRVKSASGTDGFVAGAGSNTAVVQVYRKIGDAAETLWQTINVSGTVDIRNEPDVADVAISTWGGSLTVNDTSSSSSLVQYRAALSAFSAQAVTHQSGSFDSQTITQNLSIISVES